MAIDDLLLGVRKWEMWGTFGWQDIKQRYRRSVLGPFWLTLSTGVMVAGLGIVYATIFRMPVDRYLPFLAVGLVVWTLLSTMVTEGCQVFIAGEQIIKQIRLPFTAHACRLLWRNLIIFAHNLVIVVAVLLWFGRFPGLSYLALLLPAMILLSLNALWLILLLGLISARFRDVPLLVGSLLQIAFFLTPILWHPELLPGRNRIVHWNPLYHYVEIVRAPFLGSAPELHSWWMVLAITGAGWLFTFMIFRKYRGRIALWV
jgi:ABC-type polysaccharide/polyol phosphate export permease